MLSNAFAELSGRGEPLPDTRTNLAIEDGKIAHWQVRVKIGATLAD